MKRLTTPFKDPVFLKLYNRYSKILSRIKAKQFRSERPSIRDDIFLSRLTQHETLVGMAKFDFLHNDFNHFTKEKKPKKPKRERKLMYVQPSFSDSLLAIPQRSELPAMPQPQEKAMYRVSGIDRLLTQTEYEEYKRNNPLQFGIFNGNVKYGLLRSDGTFIELVQQKKEKPLYDF